MVLAEGGSMNLHAIDFKPHLLFPHVYCGRFDSTDGMRIHISYEMHGSKKTSWRLRWGWTDHMSRFGSYCDWTFNAPVSRGDISKFIRTKLRNNWFEEACA
jgi:hypothetical protein